MESTRSSEPAQPQVSEPPLENSELSEFDDFLADLGSEPNAPTEGNDSVLKDATIAELTARLQDLQVLGDQLAATEQDRLRAVARIAELETAALDSESSEATKSEPTKALEMKITSLSRAQDRQADRLDRMRTKYEERKRVAADRWRELLELKRELKAPKRAA